MNTRLMHTVQERVVQLYQTVLDRAPRETGRNYPMTKTRRTAPTTKIDVFPGIERFTASGVIFSDGRQADFDAVVLATGYRPRVDAFLRMRRVPATKPARRAAAGRRQPCLACASAATPLPQPACCARSHWKRSGSALRSRRHARRNRLGSIPGRFIAVAAVGCMALAGTHPMQVRRLRR